MNKQENIQYHQQIEQYLEESNASIIIQQLLQQIMVAQPSNPIDFMIEKMAHKQRHQIIVIGPPGFSVSEALEKVMLDLNGDSKYDIFNCGRFIHSIVNQLSEEGQKMFKEARMLNLEELNRKIVQKIKKLIACDSNIIIQGFPKSLQQALYLQKSGVAPTTIIFLNTSQQSFKKHCEKKIIVNDIADEQQKKRLISLMIYEYKKNTKALKQFYTVYSQIDLQRCTQQEILLRQLKRTFVIHTSVPFPRHCSQIVIMGAPFSGRTSLGKKLAEKYNFIYVSVSLLLSEEIRKDSINGQKSKSHFVKHQLVDSFIVEKLVEERISRRDCRMQGFILEGYPKSFEQFENINNLKITPTFIVAIDTPKALCEQRMKVKANLDSRYSKWSELSEKIRQSNTSIFWVNPQLSLQNAFEQITHEFQKSI